VRNDHHSFHLKRCLKAQYNRTRTVKVIVLGTGTVVGRPQQLFFSTRSSSRILYARLTEYEESVIHILGMRFEECLQEVIHVVGHTSLVFILLHTV